VAKGATDGRVLTGFAGISLAVVVVVPFVFIVLQAIFPNFAGGSFDAPFVHLIEVLADPTLIRMAGNTLALGAAVMAIAALIAVPLALVRALFRVPFARLWDLVMLVPFMIPPYIATLGWIMTAQPHGYLQQLAGFNLAPVLFSFWGTAAIMAFATFPLVYFAVSRTVEAVGSRYADVARVFGADARRALWRVTLPLSTPGLAASLLLVFAATIEEYGTPTALGRRTGFKVLVVGIDQRISDFPIDLPGAATMALLLVLLSFGAFLIQRWIVARRSYQTTGSKPTATQKRELGRWTLPVLALFALVGLLSVAVPIFAVLATALSRTISGGLLKPGNLGLDGFAAILEDPTGGLCALTNSFSLGLATALLTGLIGAIAAYVVTQTQVRGRLLIDALTVLPNALPGIVVAVGLILAWNQPFLPVSPYNTPLILLLAYCCILLPHPVRYATAAFQQIGGNLEAAARVAGASRLTAFRRILLPLIAPSLIASMLLVFAVASRELVASVLVAPVGMWTISTFIWRQFEQGSIQQGMAMAFIAIVLTTLLPLVVLGLMRRSDIL
jgi:iron(III) transport system permease protein